MRRLLLLTLTLFFFIAALAHAAAPLLLLKRGDQAMQEHSHLHVAADGPLHAAWTSVHTPPGAHWIYWGIHHLQSPNGGDPWRPLVGGPVTPPIAADETGPSDRSTLDDVLEPHTWLANTLTKDGKTHGRLASRARAAFSLGVITFPPFRHRVRCVFILCAALLALTRVSPAAGPIGLHPENPHWFVYQDRTIALITSAEHYGSVLNLDFDYRRYLDALQADGLNYTRIFTGAYVEPQGAFGIKYNTLAPAEGRFLAPWARSAEPGYAGGGSKFDLASFNPEYLARLEDFLREAARRGIVVEVTFFSSTYNEKQWAVHPLNPANHVGTLAVADWKKLHTSANGDAVMAVQERLVRWLARELNEHDNFFFEIQNEPWSDSHTQGDLMNAYLADKTTFPNRVDITAPDSVAWQRAIARAIVDEESRLPKRHLIAQNVANFRLPVRAEDLVSEASILNFHYAHPEAVAWNRGIGRVIGCDETGFAGRDDTTYRRQAWNFVLSGGGLFNSLDYSFTAEKEDGSEAENKAPGGGGAALRGQLRVLSEFLGGFDLAKMRPDDRLVRRAPGVVVRALSAPGETCALYLQGRGPATTLVLDLPAGSWKARWLDPVSGKVVREEVVTAKDGATELTSPEFESELALDLHRRP